MEIIPVIDIRQGQVVHAVEGQRQNYRPLKTSLSASISPENIVQAFIYTFPFQTIYIADLDAIEGGSNNDHLIEQLHDKFNSLDFWIDQGISSANNLNNLPRWKHVIGSETNILPETINEIITLAPDVILSLDFQTNAFLGDQDLLQQSKLWPERIIIMSLARVGSNSGPDYELASSLKNITGGRKIYVAGGIRNEVDLQALNDMGIEGVLIATALHTQQITGDILSNFSKKNAP